MAANDFPGEGPERMHSIPVRSETTGIQRVGERLLAATATHRLFRFEHGDGAPSVVAERIVELADGQRRLIDIVDALCAEFDVDRGQCTTETCRFVEQLVTHEVLRWKD